jgi:hypothetical protein
MSNFREELREIIDTYTDIVIKRTLGKPSKKYDKAYNGIVDQIIELIKGEIVEKDKEPIDDAFFDEVEAQNALRHEQLAKLEEGK